ncbi:MAG: hypothetical protein ABIS92_10450 [Polyangia bacterium]
MNVTAKKLSGCSILTVALLLGLGTSANAGSNILSGNVCQTFYPPETSDGQGVYHSGSGVQNISSDGGVRLVMCPIFRDNTGNTNGMSNLTVRTTVPSGFSASTSCIAMSLTRYGSIKVGIWKTSASTGSSGMAWGNTINKSDNGSGAYDIQCNVGYGAILNSIEYSEP